MRSSILLVASLALPVGFPIVVAAQPVGAVRGVAFDSLADAPLAGAVVQIAPVGDAAALRATTADSTGHFAFDSLPSGRWVATFVHPSIELLALDVPPRAITVSPGVTTALALGLGDARQLHRSLCASSAGDSTGALLGVVRDAESGQPLDSATVTVTWPEMALGKRVHLVPRRVPAAVRPGGVFLLCGVPTDADVTIRADAPGLESGDLEVALRAGRIVRRDLSLGAAAPSGTDGLRPRVADGARVSGVVRDEHGKPVPNAYVLALGVAGSAATNEAGEFRLDGLPAGSRTIEARVLGFEPTRVVATVSRVEPAEVRLTVRKRAAVLEQVVVRGKASHPNRALEEFLDHKAHTNGFFLTPAAVEAKRALYSTDIFREVPSFWVVPRTTGDGYMLRGRGGCVPNLYINGTPVQGGADDLDSLLHPDEVMAVEVYRGAESPPQYNTNRSFGCGVVVIWTKR